MASCISNSLVNSNRNHRLKQFFPISTILYPTKNTSNAPTCNYVYVHAIYLRLDARTLHAPPELRVDTLKVHRLDAVARLDDRRDVRLDRSDAPRGHRELHVVRERVRRRGRLGLLPLVPPPRPLHNSVEEDPRICGYPVPRAAFLEAGICDVGLVGRDGVVGDGVVQWREELVHALAITDIWVHDGVQEQYLGQLRLHVAISEITNIRESGQGKEQIRRE